MQELRIWYSGLNIRWVFDEFSYFFSKITTKFHCCHPLVACGHALIKTSLWIRACGCLFTLIGGWEWKIKHMAAYLTNAQCHIINICEILHEFRPETHLELFYFVNKGRVGKKKAGAALLFADAWTGSGTTVYLTNLSGEESDQPRQKTRLTCAVE